MKKPSHHDRTCNVELSIVPRLSSIGSNQRVVLGTKTEMQGVVRVVVVERERERKSIHSCLMYRSMGMGV